MIENNPKNKAKILAVGEALLGTAHSVDDVLQREFMDDEMTIMDVPQSLLEELDDVAAECDQCGWWVEPGEVEDGVCDECRSENDDG